MRREAGYIRLDHKRYRDIMKQLNEKPIMNFLQTCRANWKSHFLREHHPRIPLQKLRYQPKKKFYRETLQAVEWEGNVPPGLIVEREMVPKLTQRMNLSY
jgi:hypothetical protein